MILYKITSYMLKNYSKLLRSNGNIHIRSESAHYGMIESAYFSRDLKRMSKSIYYVYRKI